MKPEGLEKFLSRKLELAPPVKIKPLKGGIWNDSFLVDAGGGKLVAKVFSAKFPLAFYRNSGWVEWRTLRLLEPLGIAPKPILFASGRDFPNGQLLAYEFAEGKTGRLEGKALERAARTIASYHAIKPSPSTRFIRARDDSLEGLEKETGKRLRRLKQKIPGNRDLEKFGEIFGSIQASKPPPYSPGLLHTDLAPCNFIQGEGGSLKLIDWQSPAFGDPAFDAWSFSSDAYQLWDLKKGLSTGERSNFISAYLKARKDATLRERTRAKAPFFALSLGLYYLERLTDFQSGRIPGKISEGKESLFLRYGRVKNACLKELKEII